MPVPPKTILCADDSPSGLGIWMELLDQFGYQVIVTTSPELVVPILNSVPVQLVILDYLMPELDGGAVAARIREHSAVPILLTSARVADIPESVRMLVNAVVAKQEGLSALARIVQALLLGAST